MATYLVKYGELPKVKMADITRGVGRFKLVKVALRITTPVAEKGGAWYAGELKLANPPKGEGATDWLSKVAESARGTLVLSGGLAEDEKGAQTLVLTQVAPAKK